MLTNSSGKVIWLTPAVLIQPVLVLAKSIRAHANIFAVLLSAIKARLLSRILSTYSFIVRCVNPQSVIYDGIFWDMVKVYNFLDAHCQKQWDVWGVSEGYSWKLEALRHVWRVSGIPGLTIWSPYIISAQPWNAQLFLPDHTEASKYQNVYI